MNFHDNTATAIPMTPRDVSSVPLVEPPKCPVYWITDELYNSMSVQQVNKQIAFMFESGEPVYGPEGEYLVRVSIEAMSGTKAKRHPGFFLHALFSGTELLEVYRITEIDCTGVPLSNRPKLMEGLKQSVIERAMTETPHWLEHMPALYFERNKVISYSHEGLIDEETRDCVRRWFASLILVLLHDARTHKEIIEPRRPPMSAIGRKLAARRFERTDLPPVITLHIPKRVYTGEHGGTHASPMMHFRAGHFRDQPVGPRGYGQVKRIRIEGMWINKADFTDDEAAALAPRTFKLST